MKFWKYGFLSIIILFGVQSYGQDVQDFSPTDLNNINIDELTDEQVRQFMDRAESSGLTMDQIELIAKQRGISSSQITKLRNRIRQLQLDGDKDSNEITSPGNRLRETYQNQEEDEYDFFSFLSPTDSLRSDKLEIFGLDIFRSSDLSFEPSLNAATPDNYLLGAGDELIIDVYGASEITYQEFISPDGQILISGVGPVSLSGLTVEQARTRVFNKLSTIYSGLKGRNPNTFINVSVGQVKSIKVNVVGQVVQPGTYTISSFSSAFNALYFAGGPTDNGSLRSIEINRGGEKIAMLDVYQYLFAGDDSQNPQLLDQDIIVVKPYQRRIKLAGFVKQPAIYELLEEESLEYLLEFSGGFKEGAFQESVSIDRFGGSEKEIVSVKRTDFANTLMQDGDSLYVSKINNKYSNRVKIEGAVNRPNYYQLSEGLTLRALILHADSLREDAYLARGNIIRLTNNLRLTNLSFDVRSVIDGNQDILLQPDDRVIIPSIFDIEEEQVVTIDGQTRNPGIYPFIDNMTVEDLITISGGLKEDASTTTVEVARRLQGADDLSRSSEIIKFEIQGDLSFSNASTFLLKPFDLVLIKSTPYVRTHKVVKIEGEVSFPGYYALETNEDKISDLIKRAGGLTQYGYAEGASLMRRTEYYRTELEKEELQALLDQKREELEKKFLKQTVDADIYDFVEQQLLEYEKSLTEEFKIRESSDQLEARIFRARQLSKLLSRDSTSGYRELVEKQAIGIELEKILNDDNSRYDLILRDGDLISVPKQLETVRVQGEVLYPNTIRYQAGTRFKSYVSSSGGFSTRAKVGKSYIIYANGSVKRTNKFLFFKKFPPVKPGADIIVPRKEPKRKILPQEVLGIASSLATIALIIDRITQ